MLGFPYKIVCRNLTNIKMSGDNLHHPQPHKFYADDMSETKRVLINSNYVLEIENLFAAARTRTGSLLQE